MDNNSSKNINWINAVKAICIISVFFIHCQLYYGCWMQKVNDYIHPFYVNAFFFVSGYLLFRKQLQPPLITQDQKEYLAEGGRNLFMNIVFKIAIPTGLFSMIEYVPKHILRGQSLGIYTFISNTVGGDLLVHQFVGCGRNDSSSAIIE